MSRFKLTFISLLGLIVLPATNSLQSMILIREAVTAAHLQASGGAQEHPSHNHDSSGTEHVHKHQHSPSEPEHEHKQADQSILSALESSPSLNTVHIAILGFALSKTNRALTSDQVPLGQAFASPLRPPIA
jgi:hypothetical protein